jgi:hypothetical protein
MANSELPKGKENTGNSKMKDAFSRCTQGK